MTYTESFRQRQGPVLSVLLLLNIPIMIGGVASGHWTVSLRRLAVVLELAVCAGMVWAVLDGPVVLAAMSDRFVKVAMVLIVLSVVMFHGVQFYRRVSPAPDRQVPVPG